MLNDLVIFCVEKHMIEHIDVHTIMCDFDFISRNGCMNCFVLV